METQTKGEIGALKVQLRAMEKGVIVSRPTMECRYDLILDEGGRLQRAQVKYVDCIKHGALFVTLSKRTKKCYTAEEVDCVFVYVPSIDKVMRIDAALFGGKCALCFRFEDSKNGQAKGTRKVEDFIW